MSRLFHTSGFKPRTSELRLRTSVFIFLTSCLLLLTSFSYSQQVKKVKIAALMEYIQKSDHPLVVSFWATWCAPCVEEIPWLQTAVEKYKDDKVELVLVSLDFAPSYPKKITEFVQQNKFTATFFWLNETNADEFCPKIDARWGGSIPANLFMNNKTGYRRFFDRQLTDRQAEPEVKKLVGK
jgi:thiol-disulfide isomerase/thioredoxin